MRIALAVAGTAIYLIASSSVFASDRLDSEKRMVGQSDSHEECAAKMTKMGAAAIMFFKGHPTSEDARVTLIAKHRSIGMTTEFKKPTGVWQRAEGTCDDETYIQRNYTSGAPVAVAPPPANMRDVRSHVMEAFSEQNACVEALISSATMAVGVADVQEEDEGDKSEEMRLTL